MGSLVKKKNGVELFLYNKRNRKRHRRLSRYSYEYVNRDDFGGGFYRSEIIDQLLDGNVFSASEVKASHLVKMPESFSVIDNPSGFLKSIVQLAGASRGDRLSSIYFDHSSVANIDIAAEAILGYIATEVDKELDGFDHKVEVAGSYPKNAYAKRVIQSVGTIKHLKVNHEMLRGSDDPSLKIFQEHRRDEVDSTNFRDVTDYKTRAVEKFVNHIDNCLDSLGRELTSAGKELLVQVTGEVVGNAEDHSGSEKWSICGFLDSQSLGRNCEITIFNFGRTIADTFRTLNHDSFTYQQIKPYIDKHRKNRLFKWKWKEESLLTLLALQENVSSLNRSARDDRGTGTADLIHYFQQMCGECLSTRGTEAKMAILSGHTHILFDGKYHMEPNEGGLRQICFNEDKSLDCPPDQNYIRYLKKHYFPGTIISIKFPMQEKFSEKKNE